VSDGREIHRDASKFKLASALDFKVMFSSVPVLSFVFDFLLVTFVSLIYSLFLGYFSVIVFPLYVSEFCANLSFHKTEQIATLQNKDSATAIQEMIIGYRSTPHPATGISPYEALMKRQVRTKLGYIQRKHNDREIAKEKFCTPFLVCLYSGLLSRSSLQSTTSRAWLAGDPFSSSSCTSALASLNLLASLCISNMTLKLDITYC
jgi:hypothetical protein